MAQFYVLLIFVVVNSIKSQQFCKNVFTTNECTNVKFTPETYLNLERDQAVSILNSTGTVAVETLSQLRNVTQLSLSGNAFEGIENGALCSPSNLTSLVIFDNVKFPKITRDLLENCEKLERIHLDRVGVEKGAFADLINVKSLVINGSHLGEIDSAFFAGLKTLNSLTISDSPTVKLNDDAFDDVASLIQLNLSGDLLGKVPKLGKLKALEFMDLSGNNLTDLTWDEFDGLKSLQKLFLGENPLKNVDVGKLLKHSPNLGRVFLTPDGLSEENLRNLESELLKNNVTLIYA